MFEWLNVAAACAVLAVLVGCDRNDPPVVAPAEPATVTNCVVRIREVSVTNVVTVTVTNVVVERREPERILSARKTAPYAVSARAMTASQLRKIVSDAGARVISCDPGAVALVEASERSAGQLRTLADVKPLGADDKIAADAGQRVRVIPLSSIDAIPVAEAVRSLGGDVVETISVGMPAVRARVDYSVIRKLAGRGDVRRIERDDK